MEIKKNGKKYKIINEDQMIIKLLSDRIKKLEYENFIIKKENQQLFKILNKIRKERI